MGWLARLVVVGVPEARRRDEGRVGLPIDPDAVLDAAVAVERPPDHRVAARAGVDDEVEGHRLVPVRGLEGAHRQQPKHRPDDVRDGHRVGKEPVAKEHAEPVGRGARGITEHPVEGLEDRFSGVERRLELPLRRLGAEVAEERLVVHPIEGRVLARLVEHPTASRESEEIPGLPRDRGLVRRPLGGAARSAPAHHEEQVARGVGIGEHRLAGTNSDEARAQARARGRAGTAQDGRIVERQHARAAPLVKLGVELGQRHLAGGALDEGIGGVAVVVIAGRRRKLAEGVRIVGVIGHGKPPSGNRRE